MVQPGTPKKIYKIMKEIHPESFIKKKLEKKPWHFTFFWKRKGIPKLSEKKQYELETLKVWTGLPTLYEDN